MVHREEEREKRLQELRKQAEQLLTAQNYPANEYPDNPEVRRLIHDLHVYQAELEMQNEQLMQSQFETERSRNEYARLYHFAPVSYFTLNKDGVIEQVNLMAGQMLGYNRDKLLHQKLLSFIVPRYGSDYHNFLRAVFEEKTRQSCELQIVNKAGKYYFVHLEGQVIEDEEKPLPSCLLAMVDITERKMAEDSRSTASQLQLVLETLPNLAWIARPDGSTYFYNHNWFDYTGASLDELQDWSWRRYIHPSDLYISIQLWKESIQTGKKLETSYRIKRGSDGQYRWHLVRAVPVRNHSNEILCWSGTCTDIHDQKATEEALEKRVADRTLEVLHTNEQLKTEIAQRIQVEEELRESQYFISQIADTMPDMLHVYDVRTHQTVYINRAVADFFGYTAQEMKQLGNNLMSKLIHPEDLPVSQKKLQMLVQSPSDKPVESEYRVKYKEGNWRWLRTKYAVFKRDDIGQPQQLIGIISDITEQKQAEQEIREKQYFIQQVADASPNIIYVYDLAERKNVYSNREVTELLGYSAEEVKSIGPGILQTIMHPDDYKQVQQWFDRFNTVSDGEALELEYRIKNVAGEWRWIYARETIFRRDENGRPLQLLGVAQDVTLKKQAEEKLRQSEADLKKLNEELEERVAERTRRLEETFASLKAEYMERRKVQDALQLNHERFQLALEKSPVILFTQDLELRNTWVHNAFGADDNYYIGKTDAEIFTPENAAILSQLKKEVIRTGKGIRQEIRMILYGNMHAFDMTIEPIWSEQGEVAGIACAAIDISKRKKAEAALASSEQKYRLLTEASPAMIWTTDREANMNFSNRWMVNFTGKAAEELAGKGWEQVIHPEDLPNIYENIRKFSQSKEEYQEEVRFRRADGAYVWHLRRVIPLINAQNEIQKWIGVNIDIHSQKMVEAALRDNEVLREAQRKLGEEKEFSENLLETSIDGIVAFNKDCCITAWNKMMEELNGKSKEEVLGKNIFDLFPEYQVNDEGKAILRALAGEKTTLHDHPYGIRNGFYEVHTLPLLGENQESVGGISIIHDVTERMKMEQERINLKLTQQKEMLNAVLEAQETERSRIAESLHNGLGQLLYAAKLNLEQINLEQETKDIQSIRNAKLKVADLLAEAIRDTRSISHEMVPVTLQDFGLAGAIRDFARKYSQPHFVVKTEIFGFDERLDRYLEIGIYRIAQELMNNIVKHAQATEAKIQVVQSDGRIIIKVTDNGKGFDSENVTKGMGLKSINKRVKLMNGTMSVQSKPGEGATMTITIPHEEK